MLLFTRFQQFLLTFFVLAVWGGIMDSMHAAEADSQQQSLATTLSDDEAWQRLPAAPTRVEQRLPIWSRMLASDLPKSTAALLELDLAQRTESAVPPQLRAGMRFVAAEANQCEYSRRTAEFDALRAGVDSERLAGLKSAELDGWSEAEQAALIFARKMTLDSASVTDEEFAQLVTHFGERQAASMVLLMAYSNFQDRLLLCLGATIEAEQGPLPPVEVDFPAEAFVIQPSPPAQVKGDSFGSAAGSDNSADDGDWMSISYETLQQRMEAQRRKPTRLKIPDWEQCASNLPEGLMPRPSDIIWYRIVFGYAPELAVPFEVFMRTAGAETKHHYDRIFGGSLFWIVTRSVNCSYCMGHCEMNWEVAGLTVEEIAQRSRLLAGGDWSSFTSEHQRAFAFGRKLSQTPGRISREDMEALQRDFGRELALTIALHASRYHYMVRISNGFQLTLESENVFYDYWNRTRPITTEDNSAFVPLLSDDDTWSRMPEIISGAGQPLPSWAKAVAAQMPRTAAAMLELDAVHRLQSPIDPVLRAKQRWVIAQANHCDYSEAYALADLRRAGADEATVEVLTGDPKRWPAADRDPLEFARLLTVAAPTIPDELFERLRVEHGEQVVAAMVLLAAYANFQDRIVLGLNLPMEEDGPLPPVEVEFAAGALQTAPLIPPQNGDDEYVANPRAVAARDEAWSAVTYDELQDRLERQRDRQPRLPVPTWDDVKINLPPEMAQRPTRIVWSLMNYGYAPELAIAWTTATRTHWAECPAERILEESLFWVQTRAIGCNYCMGHCEMLLEVAGLTPDAIAHRTRLLAESDWSAFPPEEQRAYAFARKLSRTPWEMTAEDYRTLEADYGPRMGMSLFWWLCRGLYMTRISDGFQLPLERDNVFQRHAPPTPGDDPAGN